LSGKLTAEALGYGTRCQGLHSFTHYPDVYPQMEWILPALGFPAEAGPHLPTPEGWKAKLAIKGAQVFSFWHILSEHLK